MSECQILTTFMCRLSWNLGASASWSPLGLNMPEQKLLYLNPPCTNLCLSWDSDLTTLISKAVLSYIFECKETVQLSLFFETPRRLNVGGNEVWLWSLVSSIYTVVDLSVSRFDPFIFREGTPVLLGRGWIGPRKGVGAVKIRKLLGLPGIEPRFPGRPLCNRVAILLNLGVCR
jgi:hypothetical protein